MNTLFTTGRHDKISRRHSALACQSGRRRLLVPLFWLVFLLVVVASGLSLYSYASRPPTTPRPSDAEQAAATRKWRESLSVVVAHHSPLHVLDEVQRRLVAADQVATTAMLRTQLPSWTLRHVEAECAECLDSETHAAAVQRQGGAAGAAVFATAAAPLGIAGPMLLAMASVTDDVDGAAELARWSWVPRSYAMRRQFSGASPAGLRGGTSPYLVVLGIPSTDQPVRAALRDAQRATWLSYREVARSGNDFCGALLPLYLFAAAERDLTSGVTDVSPLLPTVAEYEAASVARLHADNESGEVPDYGVRRVLTSLGAFRDTVLSAEQLLESPCTSVVARTVDGDTDRKSTWLAKLTSGLELPATPAAVAPAQFICHASAALWQEALAHRNVLWVDMMTDRRPTTKKKLGQGGNWGLAVDVGLSQKTILWLHYAYHAFPDVPYIMKGDDDTYVKVPQFLRDIRFLRSGMSGEEMTLPERVRDPPGVAEREECIYWGRTARIKRWGDLRYQGGSGYLLHRRLVQAVTEPTAALTVRRTELAVRPFDPSLAEVYEKLVMPVEDALVGAMLQERRERLREVCPLGYALHVEESVEYLLDTHLPQRPIAFTALLLHHVTPFDQYYLHYYFQHEYAVAQDIAQRGKVAERAAKKAAVRWMRSRVAQTTPGYGKYTRLRWAHPRKMPSSNTSEADSVTVYHTQFVRRSRAVLDKHFKSVQYE